MYIKVIASQSSVVLLAHSVYSIFHLSSQTLTGTFSDLVTCMLTLSASNTVLCIYDN